MTIFNLTQIDPTWEACVQRGLNSLNTGYLQTLKEDDQWLPGPTHIFNALTLPIDKVKYVLFGESPYPRRESAIGYAFWDGAVNDIWSESGLNKKVNRATSLRNLVKMLLVAEGSLNPEDVSQPAIAQINKQGFITTNEELFGNFHEAGFLLLNACLVLQPRQKWQDAKEWRPFIKELLTCLLEKNPTVTFLFLGRIAHTIEKLLENQPIKKICAEHPYNHTFITNPDMLNLFKPLHLLHLHKKVSSAY